MQNVPLCDICHEKPAMIHMEGVGNFCLDCHNDRMANCFGLNNDSFKYPDEAMFTDKEGNLHSFRLSHMFFGSMIRWQAIENDGEYEINMNASAKDSLRAQISKFYRKIADTLWNKSLTEIPSAWGPIQSLEDHGNIDIQCSSSTDEVYLVIDGKRYSLEEFGKLLKSYEGWTLQYQIREKSEDRLREEEYLMPVELTRETLIYELKRAIFSFSEAKDIEDDQFVSYKNTSHLFYAIVNVIDKYEYYYNRVSLEEAVEVGEEMLEILRAIETDDDSFPEYLISLIEDIIYRF